MEERKTVWHDVTEEPEKDDSLLVEKMLDDCGGIYEVVAMEWIKDTSSCWDDYVYYILPTWLDGVIFQIWKPYKFSRDVLFGRDGTRRGEEDCNKNNFNNNNIACGCLYNRRGLINVSKIS